PLLHPCILYDLVHENSFPRHFLTANRPFNAWCWGGECRIWLHIKTDSSPAVILSSCISPSSAGRQSRRQYTGNPLYWSTSSHPYWYRQTSGRYNGAGHRL